VRLPDPRLLVITDRRQALRPLDEVVAEAAAAGCRWISIREKDLPDAEQIALAQALLPIARDCGARLTLHGDPAIAAAAGLDGVHLSAGSDPAPARALLGEDRMVGVSIHGVAEARRINARMVDYLIAGPAFATDSKPGYGPSLELPGLSALAAATAAPILAIGGVTAERAGSLGDAGLGGIAVMGGVMRAAEPAREVAALLAAIAPIRWAASPGRIPQEWTPVLRPNAPST